MRPFGGRGERRAGKDEPRSAQFTWARRAVVTVLLAGVVAFLVEGADLPPDPVLVPAGEEAQTRSEEAGAAAPVRPRPPGGGSESTTTGAPETSTTTTTAPPPTSSTRAPAPETAPSPATTATSPPTANTTTTVAAPPARRPLAGFGEVPFRITSQGGTVFDGFALLAADRRSQSQGLMEQTDLRGYDAMIFRFASPSTGSFFMRNTRIPLSIAFFDEAGRFVSSADMVPCPDSVDDCPSTFPEGPYVHAIEVAAGDLPRLGIGPGAVLSFPAR